MSQVVTDLERTQAHSSQRAVAYSLATSTHGRQIWTHGFASSAVSNLSRGHQGGRSDVRFTQVSQNASSE